jgi:predicted PurR-regulated permease PerM
LATHEPTRLQIQWLVEKRWKRWFWILLAIATTLYVAYLAREIWLPLAIAFMVAMVLDPVVDRLEHRGWSRGAGAALIFATFLIVLVTTLFFAVPAIVHQGETLSTQFTTYVPDSSPKGIDDKLKKMGVHPSARTLVVQGSQQLAKTVQRSGSWLSEHGVSIASNLIWIVIIPIVAFYALKDFHLILAKTLLLVPRHRRDMVQALVAEVSVIFAKYMRGLMTVAFLNGLSTWALLLVLRVPNALLLGGVAGMLYSVPYLGALITIVLVAGVSFAAGGVKFMLLVVALNVLLHQIVFDQIISPRILGGHVGLHPILSIMALLIGNALLGVVGMVLAVPVAASIQVAVLALVPKLNQEIDLSATSTEHPDKESINFLQAETKEQQIKVDATEELHRGVGEAVEQVEASIASSEAETAANQAQSEGTSLPPAAS